MNSYTFSDIFLLPKQVRDILAGCGILVLPSFTLGIVFRFILFSSVVDEKSDCQFLTLRKKQNSLFLLSGGYTIFLLFSEVKQSLRLGLGCLFLTIMPGTQWAFEPLAQIFLQHGKLSSVIYLMLPPLLHWFLFLLMGLLLFVSWVPCICLLKSFIFSLLFCLSSYFMQGCFFSFNFPGHWFRIQWWIFSLLICAFF